MWQYPHNPLNKLQLVFSTTTQYEHRFN